ncbi:hypothetical protein T492DRAFT_880986 [Pavlovales sp. CCMP2436]|nr:hypothetical protein T492DRAFT_880986 [Pavlovales sp. CCMP2436]
MTTVHQCDEPGCEYKMPIGYNLVRHKRCQWLPRVVAHLRRLVAAGEHGAQSLILLANTCEDRIEGAGLVVRVPQRAIGVF